jgi:hypothetical protein
MNNNAEKEIERLIAKIQRANLRARLQQRVQSVGLQRYYLEIKKPERQVNYER